MNNNVFIVACNSKYFLSCTYLIYTIRKFHHKNHIYFYDLGLNIFEKIYIKNIDGLIYRSAVASGYNLKKNVESFRWKIEIIYDFIASTQNQVNIIYMDSSFECLNSFETIFNIISTDNVFFNVSPFQHKNSIISGLTRKSALELMGTSSEEMKNHFMINAGFFGLNNSEIAIDFFKKAHTFAQNDNIIQGSRKEHRHDQSILSVLRVKNNLPYQAWLFDCDALGLAPLLMLKKHNNSLNTTEISNFIHDKKFARLLRKKSKYLFGPFKNKIFVLTIIPIYLKILIIKIFSKIKKLIKFLFKK